MWSWMPLSSAAVVEAMVGVFMEGEVGVKWWECVIGSGALKSMVPGLLLGAEVRLACLLLIFLAASKNSGY